MTLLCQKLGGMGRLRERQPGDAPRGVFTVGDLLDRHRGLRSPRGHRRALPPLTVWHLHLDDPAPGGIGNAAGREGASRPGGWIAFTDPGALDHHDGVALATRR